MFKRRASAHWSGGLKDGTGTVETQSGALKAPYSFTRRFGDEPGTNPEELIAAGADQVFCISGATGEGVDALLDAHWLVHGGDCAALLWLSSLLGQAILHPWLDQHVA